MNLYTHPMFSIETHTFLNWPYDDAVQWMHDAHDALKKDPHRIIVACGSHKETVVTFGRHCLLETITLNKDALPNDAVMRQIDRGGGVTAHEPGQLVRYPVLNARHISMPIKSLIFTLEAVMINFLEELSMSATRSPLGPGVFIDGAKVGFVGLRISEGISSHGMAINLVNSAKIFTAFDPCGMKSLAVTSAKCHAPLIQPLAHYITRLLDHFVILLDRHAVRTRSYENRD